MSSDAMPAARSVSATVSTTVLALAPEIARGDLHGRRHHVRICGREFNNATGRSVHQDGDDVGKNRALRMKKVGNHEPVLFGDALGLRSSANCGSTFWPGMTRNNPATTTRSPVSTRSRSRRKPMPGIRRTGLSLPRGSDYIARPTKATGTMPARTCITVRWSTWCR